MNNSRWKANTSLIYDLAHSNRTSSKISSIVMSDRDEIDSAANYTYYTNRIEKVIIKMCNVTSNIIKRRNIYLTQSTYWARPKQRFVQNPELPFIWKKSGRNWISHKPQAIDTIRNLFGELLSQLGFESRWFRFRYEKRFIIQSVCIESGKSKILPCPTQSSNTILKRTFNPSSLLFNFPLFNYYSLNWLIVNSVRTLVNSNNCYLVKSLTAPPPSIPLT